MSFSKCKINLRRKCENNLDFFYWILKEAIIIFKSSTDKFIKNDFSNNLLNFGIRTAFSKGQKSAFFEGTNTDTGPLCKVRRQ